MALNLPRGSRIVAATHNPGKVKELAVLLEGHFDVVSAGSLGLPEPDETESTFVGNALLKARAAADACGLIALAVAWPHGPAVVVEGRVDGTLAFPPRGTNGFGYNPIFTPQGETLTFGEMEAEAKDAISHRTRAFEKLKAALFD